MRTEKGRTAAGAALALILALAISCGRSGQGQEEPAAGKPAEPGAAKAGEANAQPGVTLSKEQLAGAGIAAETLTAAKRRADEKVPGRVLSVQDLAQTRQALGRAAAEAASAQVQWEAADAESRRVEALNRSGANASLKSVESARAAAADAKSKLDASRASLESERAQARQAWGPLIAEALETGAEPAASLLEAKELPVLVTPGGKFPPEPPRSAAIVGPGATRSGRFLSAVPRTDGVLQGPSWLFAVKAPPQELPAGLNVEVLLPAGPERAGVEIPRSAVVWWQGVPWVYVEAGEGRYRRVQLVSAQETEVGLFVSSGPRAGEKLVTVGAQALLSEELKGMGVTGGAD